MKVMYVAILFFALLITTGCGVEPTYIIPEAKVVSKQKLSGRWDSYHITIEVNGNKYTYMTTSESYLLANEGTKVKVSYYGKSEKVILQPVVK
ncbi:hypothetical protein [Brevibacillus laterosporus]|uniref:hypothetical protein n=1 Tax=Brevibacillus laterosporus TaxID=1465 RepID=UPI003D19038A